MRLVVLGRDCGGSLNHVCLSHARAMKITVAFSCLIFHRTLVCSLPSFCCPNRLHVHGKRKISWRGRTAASPETEVVTLLNLYCRDKVHVGNLPNVGTYPEGPPCEAILHDCLRNSCSGHVPLYCPPWGDGLLTK